jgi:hypothetical protein
MFRYRMNGQKIVEHTESAKSGNANGDAFRAIGRELSVDGCVDVGVGRGSGGSMFIAVLGGSLDDAQRRRGLADQSP